MPRIFLFAALCNLLRHKVQTLINIASLAIGLAVFGFAFLYVMQELSYDRGWPEGERVHRLTIDQRGIPGEIDMVHALDFNRAWSRMPDYFAGDIEAIARTYQTGVSLVAADSFTGLTLAEPAFLDLFQLETLEGDLRRALSGPGFIALDEPTAIALGMTGRVGERVTFKGFNEGRVEYELAAIYRLPLPVAPATTFPMLTLMHNYSLPLFERNGVVPPPPWEDGPNVWLKLKPGISTDAFNAKQAEFVEQEITQYNAALAPGSKISDHLVYRWQPISAIHFNPHTREIGPDAGDPMRVAAFALVGLLVLLVGCSNSVSLSLAAALERRREIGVRKAAGALPREIMWQQLAESVLKALLALVPALVAVELLAPALQALLPVVSVDPSWRDHALLIAIALGVGLACGVYPALVLSATRPQAVLRAGAQAGQRSGMSLRTALVAVQFCFASMLLIVTSALYLQLAVARAQPLGFDPGNIILLERSDDGDSMPALRAELETLPGVLAVVQGPTLPPNAEVPINFGSITLVASLTDTSGMEAQEVSAEPDFIDFMRMQIVAGRGFDAALDAPPAQPQSVAPGAEPPLTPVIINAAAARELGLTPEQAVNLVFHQRAINRRTGEVRSRPLQVVGVMEDNLYISLRRRAGPVIFFATGGARSILLLRYDDASESTIQQTINDAALRVHGKPLRSIDFLKPQIDAAFMTERNESKLLLICGGLALVLASIGLYGLAAFAVERQVKEVGVRKVLGASASGIVRLFLWRFSRPIMLANVIAWPAASYFVLQWIQRFPYQMERAWLVPLCIATLAAVLLIAMLTVSVITTRAATVNPVRSLRYE